MSSFSDGILISRIKGEGSILSLVFRLSSSVYSIIHRL